MKKLLRAAFKISLWELLVIIVFGAFKYILVTYGLSDKISKPFIWICLGAGILFLFALGVVGIFENKRISLETWEAEDNGSKWRRLVALFVVWGQFIPTALGFLLFIYLIAPTTVSVFIALVVGIVLRNSIHFFEQRKKETVQEAS